MVRLSLLPCDCVAIMVAGVKCFATLFSYVITAFKSALKTHLVKAYYC